MEQATTSKSRMFLRRSSRILFVCLFLCFPRTLCSYIVVAYVKGMELICWEAQYLRDVFLENNAKFKLPPTARNVQVATKNGSSWCSIAVSFEMASSELAVFEDGIQVGKLSSTTPIKWGLQPHEELVSKLGFNLTANLPYLFAYTDDDYFDQQFVFVGTKDVETYIVYLVTEVGFLD